MALKTRQEAQAERDHERTEHGCVSAEQDSSGSGPQDTGKRYRKFCKLGPVDVLLFYIRDVMSRSHHYITPVRTSTSRPLHTYAMDLMPANLNRLPSTSAVRLLITDLC
jgi:hypothetical protein